MNLKTDLKPSRVYDTYETAPRLPIGHLNLRVADLDRGMNCVAVQS
jgi:hypothetical protein